MCNLFQIDIKIDVTLLSDLLGLKQVAFLSTLVGEEVAEKAASAAVKTLTEVNNETSEDIFVSSGGDASDHGTLFF